MDKFLFVDKYSHVGTSVSLVSTNKTKPLQWRWFLFFYPAKPLYLPVQDHYEYAEKNRIIMKSRNIIRAIIYLLQFCGVIIIIDFLFSNLTPHKTNSFNLLFDIVFGCLFWILFIFSGRLQK